jgi:salicylate hydroxylase
LNVVIVGGGIGGLFAANALIAQGMRVSVMSRRPRSARSAPVSS